MGHKFVETVRLTHFWTTNNVFFEDQIRDPSQEDYCYQNNDKDIIFDIHT